MNSTFKFALCLVTLEEEKGANQFNEQKIRRGGGRGTNKRTNNRL